VRRSRAVLGQGGHKGYAEMRKLRELEH
jgi:hypothetical protein